MIGAGVEKINFLQTLFGKDHSILLFSLFKIELSDVSILKDIAEFSQ